MPWCELAAMVDLVTNTLPIDEHLEQITNAVSQSGAVVVVAEPGAGKTTRVPWHLQQQLGLEVFCTQPRRIAARLSAKRVAEESGTKIGQEVGYEVRFDKKVSAATRLRFLTEGLAQRQWKRISQKNCILILDEFHERHLDADMLLALAAKQRKAGQDLRIVVMSATLDPKPISDFLGGAPIVISEGRQYPVSISYQIPRDRETLEVSVSRAIKKMVQSENTGHILVFLPGIAEIKKCYSKLSEFATHTKMELVILHGSLASVDQDKALKSSTKQKIILSTNVAETSLTIPGVTAVIDCGTAKVNRHSPWTGLATLALEEISQASAKQRAGRAGRTAPGHCIRLYSEHTLKTGKAFDSPEIIRSDLSTSVLQLASMNTSMPDMQWLEPPPDKAYQKAFTLLQRLGAFHENTLSPLGEQMSQFPVHPRLARLLIESKALGITREGSLAAALLSERPLRHSQRSGKESDFSSQSDLQDDLDALEELRQAKSKPQLARSAGLDLQTAKNIEQTAKQLYSIQGANNKSSEDPDTDLRKALLCAFPDRVAKREIKHSPTLLLCQGGAITQSRSSAVIDAQYLLAIDLVSSQRNKKQGGLLRVASEIDPLWLLDFPLAHDIDKHEYENAGERVVRKTGIYYGDFSIDEERIVDPNKMDLPKAWSQLHQALVGGKLQQVIDQKQWLSFCHRMAFAASNCPSLTWPTHDDDSMATALLNMAVRPTRLSDLQKLSVVEAVQWSLCPALHKALENYAPTHITLPTRKRVPVQYEPDRAPWIQSRLQDFFGLKEGPKLGQAKVPLTLHLLAPNRRAVQVTTDLPGFWERHYPALRKQLMRRYPRHKWPESP